METWIYTEEYKIKINKECDRIGPSIYLHIFSQDNELSDLPNACVEITREETLELISALKAHYATLPKEKT